MKHKICIIIPCLLNGGTEVQVLYQAIALKEEYEVIVICLFEFDQSMLHRYKSHGINVIKLDSSGCRPKGLLKQIVFLQARLIWEVKQINPRVIHTQFLAPGFSVLVLLRLNGFKNLITTAHSPRNKIFLKFIPTITSVIITRAFICVSKYLESSFFSGNSRVFNVEEFIKGRKHFTIQNCVDIDEVNLYNSQPSSVVYGIRKNILCVSRLSWEKGIDVVLQAMPIILNSFPNLILFIIGDGNEKEQLVNLTNRLKISGNVVFTGSLPREKVYQYYLGADIVVVPSRIEGFGLSAAEAMAFGKVVIASNTGGLSELIEHGKNGWLFSNGSIDELGTLVISTLADNKCNEMIEQAARKKIELYFSFQVYKSNLLGLYSLLTS